MAISVEQRQPITAEDLAAPGMPEKFVELVEGELIEMTPAGRRHNKIAYRLHRIFDTFCMSRPDLDFAGDNDGFLIQRNPDTLLSPDACLFRARPDTGATWLEFAPEIVVEVISPSNNEAEMMLKRQRCFAAGTEQFWLIFPDERKLVIHHRDNRIITLTGDACIEGEGIAAGLKIELAEIFRER